MMIKRYAWQLVMSYHLGEQVLNFVRVEISPTFLKDIKGFLVLAESVQNVRMLKCMS